MPEPVIPTAPDVDIDAELEALPLKEGEADSGLVGGESDDTETLPGPVNTEGEVSVPPVVEGPVVPAPKIEDGGDDGSGGEEDKPVRVFQTQEDYDEFVEAQKNKAIVELLNKPKDTTPNEPLKFFSDVVDPTTGETKAWQPKDWNDFTNALINNPVARKALVDTMSPDIKNTLDNLSEQEQKELDSIDKEYDKEYGALATKGLVPKLGTEEGALINKQISTIGAEYGIVSIEKAHELWAKIPQEQGGGLEYTTKKGKIATRKQNSALLTPPRKAQPSTDKKKDTYEHISGTDVDSLIEEGIEEYA